MQSNTLGVARDNTHINMYTWISMVETYQVVTFPKSSHDVASISSTHNSYYNFNCFTVSFTAPACFSAFYQSNMVTTLANLLVMLLSMPLPPSRAMAGDLNF